MRATPVIWEKFGEVQSSKKRVQEASEQPEHQRHGKYGQVRSCSVALRTLVTLIKELGRLVRVGVGAGKLSRVWCAHGCVCERKGSIVGTGSSGRVTGRC